MTKRLIALAISAIFTCNLFAQISDYKKWMAGLDDNMFLWRLSIPAAHDACTSGQSGSAKTQTYNLAGQLERGVRMFDLRPRWDGSNMYIYHGITKTSVKFNDALQTLCTFLDENPSEFLFVIMRHEDDGASNAQKEAWPDQMYECLNAKRSYIIDYSPTLTVKEMRGKLLVMSRNHYTDGPIGSYLEGGGDNSVYDREIAGPDNARMRITTQDMYKVDGDGQLANKVSEIKNLLNRSVASNEGDYRLYFNHTSGYSQTFFGISTSAGVQECAKTCNKAVIDYMDGKTGPMGFILMDFAGDNNYYGQQLIDLIINNNQALMAQENKDGRVVKPEGTYISPMAADKYCEVKYIRKEGALGNNQAPATDWNAVDYDDSSWQTLAMPMGSKSYNAPYRYTWEGEYNTYWIRREIQIENANAAKYTLRVYHDDSYDIYVNGTRVHSRTGDGSWTDPGKPDTVDITRHIKSGKNVIATHIQQNWGGAYFDFGILAEGETTGIANFSADTTNNVDCNIVYDLQGRKVANAQKGIYIINGKKILK